MGGPFEIAALRRRLQAIIDRKDVRPTTLSLEVGRNPSLVKDLLTKTGDAKISTLYKLADALNVDIVDLLEDEVEALPAGPRLFVKGEVAAGQWAEAYEWPRDDWLTYTGRPDIKVGPEHRFFLRVVGDSMNLVYPEGTLIECISIQARVEVKPGKRVVVIRRRSDQMVEATVKELVEEDGVLWLAPRSTNPAHRAFRVDQVEDDDIEEIQIIAIVAGSVRPE